VRAPLIASIMARLWTPSRRIIQPEIFCDVSAEQLPTVSDFRYKLGSLQVKSPEHEICRFRGVFGRMWLRTICSVSSDWQGMDEAKRCWSSPGRGAAGALFFLPSRRVPGCH
jgi:hypothetical protein